MNRYLLAIVILAAFILSGCGAKSGKEYQIELVVKDIYYSTINIDPGFNISQEDSGNTGDARLDPTVNTDANLRVQLTEGGSSANLVNEATGEIIARGMQVIDRLRNGREQPKTPDLPPVPPNDNQDPPFDDEDTDLDFKLPEGATLLKYDKDSQGENGGRAHYRGDGKLKLGDMIFIKVGAFQRKFKVIDRDERLGPRIDGKKYGVGFDGKGNFVAKNSEHRGNVAFLLPVEYAVNPVAKGYYKKLKK